jgi:hypothetical protein
MMPVTPITGEPGGVETQDRSDFSRAKPGYEPLEVGPGHHSAGGAAKVVIDHFDIAEPPATRLIDSRWLSILVWTCA